MGIVKNIADHFRSAPKVKTVDHYGILSPLLATGDYVLSTSELYAMFKTASYTDLVKGRIKPSNNLVEKAIIAYKDYVKGLPGREQSLEVKQPFSTILLTLESIGGNINQIEDNFHSLFVATNNNAPEVTLRSSSLIVIGYLEKVDNLTTWLGNLAEHLTAETGDMIPPFRTKELLGGAVEAGEFSTFNLYKWNFKQEPLLNEIKEMQRKGSDLTIQADNGTWIDEFAHDNQFSSMEQTLMTASLKSPIMMAITWGIVRTQDKINLLSSRKDWLTSKIILEQSRLRGLNPESPEYKRLKKATDHYSNLVSKYEQKIERMRA